jgi:hypothetical protein
MRASLFESAPLPQNDKGMLAYSSPHCKHLTTEITTLASSITRIKGILRGSDSDCFLKYFLLKNILK